MKNEHQENNHEQGHLEGRDYAGDKKNFFLAIIRILRVIGKDTVSVKQALGSIQ